MSEPPHSDSFDYSPHALRLDGREWLVVIGIVLFFAVLAPRLWKRYEAFAPSHDYRIPYSLSDDYWLYERRLDQAVKDSNNIVVIGDSVVWGEYVTPDGTLSHFLNEQSGGEADFVNGGINGLFPLALEGLLRDFGQPLRNRKVVLHSNLLWMTSPEADLSAAKEQRFNHESLVPQFTTRIPCYRAPLDRRLGYLADRKIAVFAWSKHLQISYFDQLAIPEWTLEPGNWAKNPLAQLSRGLPEEPSDDPERGERSSRHRPWSDGTRQPQNFEWVAPGDSLQYAAFQRLVTLLQSRGNDLLVVTGPFNEHMIADRSRPGYRDLKSALTTWLEGEGVAVYSPPVLPTERYGDASHPLTDGYRELATVILQSPEFRQWREGG